MTLVNPVFALAATGIALLTCFFLGRFRPTVLPSGRYRSIDGLRGYLAFFVFLDHATVSYFFVMTGRWRSPPSDLFVHMAEASVAFFFMITGFLFFGKVLDSRGRKIDWPRFFVGRVLRLWPLYFVAVMAMMVLVFVESNGVLVDSIGYVFRSVVRWFLFTFFGAPSVNGVETGLLMAGVNWTLPYEWYFYLGMPLLALAGRIQVAWPYILLSVAALAYALASGASLFFIAIFGGGVIAAFAVRVQAFTQFAKTNLASVLVLTCLCFLVAYFPTAYDYPQLMLLAVAFSLIAGGADIFGALAARPSHILGELSYSVYLLHGMLLFAALKYVIGYDVVRSLSPIGYWCVIWALVPVLLIIATGAFRLIEFPGMQLTPRVMTHLRGGWRKPVVPIDEPLADAPEQDSNGSAF